MELTKFVEIEKKYRGDMGQERSLEARTQILLNLIDTNMLGYLCHEVKLLLPVDVLKIILQYTICHSDVGIAYEARGELSNAIKEHVMAVTEGGELKGNNVWKKEFLERKNFLADHVGVRKEVEEKFAASMFKAAIGYQYGMNAIMISENKARECTRIVEAMGFHGAKIFLGVRRYEFTHPLIQAIGDKFFLKGEQAAAVGDAEVQLELAWDLLDKDPTNPRIVDLVAAANNQGCYDAVRDPHEFCKVLVAAKNSRAIEHLINVAKLGQAGLEKIMMMLYKELPDERGAYWLKIAESRGHPEAITETFKNICAKDMDAGISYLVNIADHQALGKHKVSINEVRRHAMMELHKFFSSENSGTFRDKQKASFWINKYNTNMNEYWQKFWE